MQKEDVGAFLFFALVVEVPSCVCSRAKGKEAQGTR
jgi:hypothetical protein